MKLLTWLRKKRFRRVKEEAIAEDVEEEVDEEEHQEVNTVLLFVGSLSTSRKTLKIYHVAGKIGKFYNRFLKIFRNKIAFQ